ncbi:MULTISPECIES: putative RNA methyltransferase [Pseudonocardia]|jgi:23S rRNA (guanine745-N1)-methyltransferase|uniref:putative RNA methyltransferase n=1 Tax=Pseudonocardia TaxID=1847 RepID=UPI0033828AEF
MRCPSGHAFDIARTGHLSLLPGRRRHRGDTAAMVDDREAFLTGDHYRPLRSTITALICCGPG